MKFIKLLGFLVFVTLILFLLINIIYFFVSSDGLSSFDEFNSYFRFFALPFIVLSLSFLVRVLSNNLFQIKESILSMLCFTIALNLLLIFGTIFGIALLPIMLIISLVFIVTLIMWNHAKPKSIILAGIILFAISTFFYRQNFNDATLSGNIYNKYNLAWSDWKYGKTNSEIEEKLLDLVENKESHINTCNGLKSTVKQTLCKDELARSINSLIGLLFDIYIRNESANTHIVDTICLHNDNPENCYRFNSITPEQCKKVNNIDNQNDCIYQLAYRKGDPALCVDIATEKREACIWEAGWKARKNY